MGPNALLHAVAGFGAMLLGVAVLAAAPRRRRAQAFAGLALSLAVWTLGFAAAEAGLVRPATVRPWYLLGSCAAAPFGLELVLMITGRRERGLRRAAQAAWLACLLLWLFLWPNATDRTWNLFAIVVLGVVLGAALVLLALRVFARSAAPGRGFFALVLIGGAVAVVGGLSDFARIAPGSVPLIGPPATLFLLVLLASAVLRYRYLDVEATLARVAVLVAGSGLAALVVWGVQRVFGTGIAVLFIILLPVLAIAGPAGSGLRRRVHRALGGTAELSHALVDFSRGLAEAEDEEALRALLGEIPGLLPRGVRCTVLHGSARGPWTQLVGLGEAVVLDAPGSDALASWLAERPEPVTLIALEAHEVEGEAPLQEAAGLARARLRELDATLAVPLLEGPELVGVLLLGGGNPAQYLAEEVGAALMAVGQQMLLALRRFEALALARRREALAAVGELAAGLAHELQNPVASIRGAAQVIEAADGGQPDPAMLAVIGEETGRLGRVVGEFLDYARPGRLRRDDVELVALLEQSLRALAPAGIEPKLDLERELEDTRVSADADQLQRAFSNVVRNAWEAGARHLCVRLRGDAERVELSFEDDGPGFPAGALEKVFLPFYTEGKEGGTGLGLPLVQKVMELHGGSAQVAAGAGKGAVVTLSWPRGGNETGGEGVNDP